MARQPKTFEECGGSYRVLSRGEHRVRVRVEIEIGGKRAAREVELDRSDASESVRRIREGYAAFPHEAERRVSLLRDRIETDARDRAFFAAREELEPQPPRSPRPMGVR